MSKGPFGVENPAFYGTIITLDGRWMITCSKDGELTKLPGFLGSLEDAQAAADAFNAREQDRYKTESLTRLTAHLKDGPSLKEMAEQLGIRFYED